MAEKGYLQAFYGKLVSDITWLKTMGPWVFSAFALLLIIYLIANPEKTKAIKVWFLAIVAVLGYFQKNYVGTKLENQIATGCSELNNLLGQDFLSSNIEIKWVTQVDRDSFIRDGKVIIKLSYKDNPNRNFVNAVVTYLSEGFLPEAKLFVSPDIIRSSQLLVARKLIHDQFQPALGCFMDEVYTPIITEKPELKRLIDNLNLLDQKGFFMQILLPELLGFGKDMSPTIFPSESLHRETEKLLDFLVSVANKEQGVNISPEYMNEMFSFSIMILAKRGTIEARGLQPYIDYVRVAINRGYRKIYIVALGRRVSDANDLTIRIKNMPGIVLIEKKKTRVAISTGTMNGVCYVVSVAKQTTERESA